VPVRICTPFDVHINIRRIPGIATRILKLLSIEYATLWYRRWSYVFLRAALHRAAQEAKGAPVTIYAQDPMSAKAGLVVQHSNANVRVVMVAHYNISEANEQVMVG